ncbi:hypothetical protein QTP88_007230 [Uroleucon formosanum]
MRRTAIFHRTSEGDLAQHHHSFMTQGSELEPSSFVSNKIKANKKRHRTASAARVQCRTHATKTTSHTPVDEGDGRARRAYRVQRSSCLILYRNDKYDIS